MRHAARGLSELFTVMEQPWNCKSGSSGSAHSGQETGTWRTSRLSGKLSPRRAGSPVCFSFRIAREGPSIVGPGGPRGLQRFDLRPEPGEGHFAH
jgi:hypothetical protein